MSDNIYISGFCKISQNSVIVNGTTLFEKEKGIVFHEFIKEAYKFSGMSYPKFFKMDNLSKLGMVSTEFLLKAENNPDISGERTGIVLVNSSSSLDTDKTYQKTISSKTDYFPSPAVFVYTLPNIVIGEICIKHKVTGESIFFVSKNIDAAFMHSYVCDLIERQGIVTVILGWTEYLENEYVSLFCLVKNTTDYISEKKSNFTIENLNEVFNLK